MPPKKKISSESRVPEVGDLSGRDKDNGHHHSNNPGAEQTPMTSNMPRSEKTESLEPGKSSDSVQQHEINQDSSNKAANKRCTQGANVEATLEEAGRSNSIDSYRRYSRSSSFIKDLRAKRASMNFPALDYDATVEKEESEQVSQIFLWEKKNICFIVHIANAIKNFGACITTWFQNSTCATICTFI